MLAITDTVKNLSPVLSLVGGPYGPAAALGANALATISGVFIKLFKSNRQNMTKPDDRQAFLSNSCGLYQLHEGIRTILQGQFNELPMINKTLDELEVKLNNHDLLKPEPAKVSAADLDLGETIKELKQRFAETLALQTQFTDVPAISCAAIQSLVAEHNSGQGLTSKLLKRFSEMLSENQRAGLSTATTKPVLEMITNLKLSDLIPATSDKEKECVAGGAKWIKYFQTLISLAETELNRPGRLDLSCLNSNILLKNWQKENEKIKKEYDDGKTRMSFLRSFSGTGQEFEMSELLNARNSIANSLLGNSGGAFSGKSPAESWLSEMWRSSEFSVRKFNEILKSSPIESMNCNVAESTIFEWFKAKSNIQAALSYCESFENIIQGTQFKSIKTICSSTDRESLKLQDKVISDLKKEALKITAKMRNANCSNAITKQDTNMWRNDFLGGRDLLTDNSSGDGQTELFSKPKPGWVEQCFDQFN